MMKALIAIAIVLGYASSGPVEAADGPESAWPFDAKEAAIRQNDAAKTLGVPKVETLKLGNNVTLRLVLIKAGRFVMGSPQNEKGHQAIESPQHEVTITKPFYLGVYKVTQAQYEQLMHKNPSLHKGKNHPVDSVRWKDANEFCRKLAQKTDRRVHLPTEAQWEWACRAGTSSRYFFGDDESQLSTYCWWHDNCGGTTHPVGQKKPNAWGLYDMHGLSWEWCSDFFANAYPDAKATDPQGPASGELHSTRGGTFGSRPPFVRSAVRLGIGDDSVNDRFGFRVAMDLE